MKEAPMQLAKVLAETACEVGCTPPGLAGHDVQFYRSDDFLSRSVVDFLAAGVQAGQPVIVIATEPHRRAFSDGLRALGLDPDQAFTGRLAVWLDARETLDAFMEGEMPNRELFMATVGSIFERLLENRRYLVVRAFGEMVDLLLRHGNFEGAEAVERLWNELAAHYKYSLLCGYSIENFLHEAGESGFRRVCGHHARALPIEAPAKNVA